MPTIEIDSEEVSTLRAAKGLFDKLNGTHRGELQRLVKKAFPDASIPEIDIVDPVKASLADMQAQAADIVAQLKAEKEGREATLEIQGRIDTERNKLRKQGWDDEGIQAIEAKMQEEGISSYRAAAALVEKEHHEAEPIATNQFGWSNTYDLAAPGDDENHKLLLQNPSAWSKQEVSKFYKDKKTGTSAGRKW